VISGFYSFVLWLVALDRAVLTFEPKCFSGGLYEPLHRLPLIGAVLTIRDLDGLVEFPGLGRRSGVNPANRAPFNDLFRKIADLSLPCHSIEVRTSAGICSFKGRPTHFAYAAIMLYGGVFQNSSAICWLCNFPGRLPSPPNESHGHL
jgi:hypothetical protein